MCENSLKMQQNREISITCSHFWYVNIPKYVDWLYNHTVNVWWKYVFPSLNADHFCDIIFIYRTVFPICKKTVLESKNLSTLELTKIIDIFNIFSSLLYKIMQAGHALPITDKQITTSSKMCYVDEPIGAKWIS